MLICVGFTNTQYIQNNNATYTQKYNNEETKLKRKWLFGIYNYIWQYTQYKWQNPYMPGQNTLVFCIQLKSTIFINNIYFVA